MKLMNIVGWGRTKPQKNALKAKRKERRLKRETSKYLRLGTIRIEARTRRINRKLKMQRA
jgi:hypothetical protein